MKPIKLIIYNVVALCLTSSAIYCCCNWLGISLEEVTIQNILVIITILLSLNLYWHRRLLSPLKINYNKLSYGKDLNLKIDFINLSSFDIKINDVEVSGYSNSEIPFIIKKESTILKEVDFFLIKNYPNQTLIIKYQYLGLRIRKTLKITL